MTPSQFFSKFKSTYLWGNLLAMALVLVVIALGVAFGLNAYTRHGQVVTVPNMVHKQFDDASHIAGEMGLELEVADTGYQETLPPGCILEQSTAAGTRVKPGRVIYVTINAKDQPTIALPDIIDNCSRREAIAKLQAMGFTLGQVQEVPGEKDWVYGIIVGGRHVSKGDRIPVGAKVIVEVGNGMLSESDSVNYVDPEIIYSDGSEADEDEFEEVDGGPSTGSGTPDKGLGTHEESTP